MEILSNVIIFSAAISFGSFAIVSGRNEESQGLESSIFSRNPIVGFLILLIGLIVPPYFLFQDNTILMTILKTVGIYALTMILGGFVFMKRNNMFLSLMSLLFMLITVISIIIYFIL